MAVKQKVRRYSQSKRTQATICDISFCDLFVIIPGKQTANTRLQRLHFKSFRVFYSKLFPSHCSASASKRGPGGCRAKASDRAGNLSQLHSLQADAGDRGQGTGPHVHEVGSRAKRGGGTRREPGYGNSRRPGRVCRQPCRVAQEASHTSRKGCLSQCLDYQPSSLRAAPRAKRFEGKFWAMFPGPGTPDSLCGSLN